MPKNRHYYLLLLAIILNLGR